MRNSLRRAINSQSRISVVAKIAVIEKQKIYERVGTDSTGQAHISIAIVDDPLEHGAKLKVLRNIRDDPLAGMHSRGQIDDAMLAAGREWQRHHEHSEIGAISAIDPAKEAVDGGRIPEPITDRQIHAMAKMREANRELGPYGASIIMDVLGRRMSIIEIAAHRNMPRRSELEYLGKRFRECLNTLAKLWGYAG